MNEHRFAFGRFLASFLALALIIYGAGTIGTAVASRVPPSHVTVIPLPSSESNATGPVAISYKTYELECGSNKRVINAIIDVEISGGVPPYDIEIDPGNQIISDLPASILRLTLAGGKSATVKVKSATSDGQPMDSKDIHSPSHDETCESSTPSITPTIFATPTITLTPRKVTIFTSTSTKEKDHISPVSTNAPQTNLTSTLASTKIISDPTTDSPNITPATNPANTATNAPPATATPRSATATNFPPATTTPRPSTATNPPPATPTTHPSLAECEDGRDNDGDGEIDMDDDQCQRSNDNHEDH